MFKKKPIPVFLFTGFLDSGKTTFIKETLAEGQFEDGRNMLYILCEEGEVEITGTMIKNNHLTIKTIEDEEDVSAELFARFEKETRPARVLIECNGMWDQNEILEAMPENWELAEGITTVDSTTFESYLANMKMMMTNQFVNADLVVFNRCTENHDRAMFKRMVRAVNRRAQVLFEDPEGNVDNKCDEELPYDINADIINIEDDDFGIFYIDTMDHLDAYKGKTVRFKALVHKPKLAGKDMFVAGRFAMTCCADDVQFVGYPCRYMEAKSLVDREWIYVTARMDGVFRKEYGEEVPVLYAEDVTTDAPAPDGDDIVYFN